MCVCERERKRERGGVIKVGVERVNKINGSM